jgi:hypothetical protein
MNTGNELLKIAAARIIAKERDLEKTAFLEGLLTLATLGGLGWAASKIWPTQWSDLKTRLLNVFGLTRNTPTAPTETPTAPTTEPQSIGKAVADGVGRRTIGGIKPFTTRTVVPGDTLSEITGGDPEALRRLLAYNPSITNPDLIYPGMQIRLRNNEA